MTSANALRGEIHFPLAGQTFLLRPDFTALERIEERVGSIYVLLGRFARKDMSAMSCRALATIVHAGIVAGWDKRTEPPTYAQVGQWLQDDGFLAQIERVIDFLTRATSTVKDLEKAKEDLADPKAESGGNATPPA